jgi:zinc transporter 10
MYFLYVKLNIVYIYASVSIIAISVLGVVCVAIVPVLNKCCFDYLFQFLTALALGTLCGDALFHLIPHVFVGHAHEDSEESYFDRLLMPRTHHGDHESSDQHSAGIYKGVAVFAGIYIFFIIETLLQITKSGGSQAKNKPPPRPVSLVCNCYFLYAFKIGEGSF